MLDREQNLPKEGSFAMIEYERLIQSPFFLHQNYSAGASRGILSDDYKHFYAIWLSLSEQSAVVVITASARLLCQNPPLDFPWHLSLPPLWHVESCQFY